MPSFACFRWLSWRTPHTLQLLNQVRPLSLLFKEDISHYSSLGDKRICGDANDWMGIETIEILWSSVFGHCFVI